MAANTLPEVVIKNFERLFGHVSSGHTGIIPEESVEPVQGLDSLTNLLSDNSLALEGEKLLTSLVVVRLNGGLGTSMGLDRAKSLLKVKTDLSFNDIIARQLLEIRARYGVNVPLLHMTSFSTDTDIREAMQRYPELMHDGIPRTFLQHKHPKLYADTLLPASEEDDELNWNPPGHGDLYAALVCTGVAEALLAKGKRYMFVANADNLGATVEPTILGYINRHELPFLMETAQRTSADSKGGHLARSKTSGTLLLRESGQAPRTSSGELAPEFRDITRHTQFNTNNIWLDLKAVLEVASRHEGCIPLPLISNRKTVNPCDRGSREVIQIETAMGAAIEVFNGATALEVPRSRFAPVKTNNDLLIVRSNAYELTKLFELMPATKNGKLPTVDLDPTFFGLIKDFESRIKIVPSLREASHFVVRGDIVFDHELEVVGKVEIRGAEDRQVKLPVSVKRLKDDRLELS